MSTYLTTGMHGSKSSPRLQKSDSLDEKYTKRRKQEWVAEYKEQQLQQRQLLTFGGVITVLFIFVLVFFWELPTSSVTLERTPADISRKIKVRRHHLRDGSGDSADRRNKGQASMDDDSDDDDIAVVAKPVDTKNLDKRMAQTIEDLKKFQQEKDLLHKQQLEQQKHNPNVYKSNDKQGT